MVGPNPATDDQTQYWLVAVDAPIWEPLTYSWSGPEPLNPGAHVVVPLGRRNAQGVVVAATCPPRDYAAKPIGGWVEDGLIVPPPYLQWSDWLSKYYVYPLGQILAMFAPPLKRKGRGSKKKSPVPVGSHSSANRPTLTPEQLQVVEAISRHTGFSTHLIWGVTGSGKTEVYLSLIEQHLSQGKGALFLVPEISLTPQTVRRFSDRFGNQVALLHSQLTDREKTDQWWSIVSGEKKILIGARSALFCPVPNLGMIVIDEEHETSFKQEDHLRYHARDASIMLAKQLQIPLIMGSATPSLESFSLAQTGQHHLHEMKSRVADRPMPLIEVVDLREHGEPSPSLQLPHWMTETLYSAMIETLSRGKQAALFLNRRGIAPSMICTACGFSWTCPNCSISLTVHGRGHLLCHYCGYHENPPRHCTRCGEDDPKPLGAGTEQIESDVARLFPQARVARADRDEIQSREDLEHLVESMERQDVDILIGTQMIAKGLDFPGLDLVGVVLADVGLNVPDFRAAERAFQLLTQVAGRSGRHVTNNERGKVIIQTYNPQHPAVQFTLSHSYRDFASVELQTRDEMGYPPAGRLCSVRVSSSEQSIAEAGARTLHRWIDELLRQRPQLGPIEILGPTEAPLSKLKGQHRFLLLLKSPQPLKLSQMMGTLLRSRTKSLSKLKISVDIDPHHMS